MHYVSGARLMASVHIADQAFTTFRDVIVKNPGGGSSAKVNAFLIKS